jgi:DNA mismatch endonuclease (patch repair protein)
VGFMTSATCASSSGVSNLLQTPTALVRRRMQRTPQCDTPEELAIRSLLHKAGYRFLVNSPVSGSRSRPDIVFCRRRVAVFIDGCFWHGCPRHATWPKMNAEWWRNKILGNKARDLRTVRLLRRAGWKVLRIWAHEPPERAVRRIVRLLNARP